MSWRARVCNMAIRHVLRGSIDGKPLDAGAASFGRRMAMAAALLPLPEAVRRAPAMPGGVPCEWVVHADVHADAPVLVYLHGGGFVAGSARTHRDVAWRLGRAARARTLLVDYRLAPAHPFPAARDDVLAVLDALLQSGVSCARIALAGDSAGGNLAVSAARHMAGRGLPPAAVACFSPWLDLAQARTQPRSEHMLTPGFLEAAAAAYAGGHDLRDPRLSPLYADPRGLPPLHVCVADGELLQQDAARMVAQARLAGVEAELRVHAGQAHAFPTFAAMNPGARGALAEAGAFLRARFPQAGPARAHDHDRVKIAGLQGAGHPAGAGMDAFHG